MATVKLGDKQIPVVDTITFTGEPISPSWNAILTALYNKGWTARSLYRAGISVGYKYSAKRSGGVSEPQYSEATINGGRTGLGDSSEAIVSMVRTYDPNNSRNTTAVLHLTLVRQDGETATELYSEQVFNIVTMWAGSTASEQTIDSNMFAVEFVYPEAAEEHSRVKSYAIGMVNDSITSGDVYTVVTSALFLPIAYINKTRDLDLGYEPEPEPGGDDPNNEDDPADEDGGDGDHTPTYDPIPIPNKPTQGAATAGFVTLYKLHQGIMSQFASDCFASNLWEALKLFFSNPLDFLVGVNLLPFEPTGGLSWKPKFGAISFAHAYPTVANQYVDVDCGSITIPKYWGSAFDFEPYTKIQIWLPYIGYRDLPVDEIMGTTISVTYRCDCLTGDCVAFVHIGVVGELGPQIPRVIAQFYGNCAVRVPFSSVSYDSAISNSIALIGAAAASGISAGAGSISEGTKIGAGLHTGINAAGEEMVTNSSGMGVVSGLKPNIHKGGAAGASTGYMSIQVPYIIRRIPRQNLPSNYKDLKGYPCNIGGKLSEFSGLAIVDDIQLNDIPALEDERKEIINWLRGGVLI